MMRPCQIAAAAVLAIALFGCANEGADSLTASGAGLVAYYDGHYGPFQAGYWGMNGYFYYLDTEYYVPIRIDTQRMIRGAPQEFETSLGDYKQVNGVYLPFSSESGSFRPGFSSARPLSFHLVILPRKMPATGSKKRNARPKGRRDTHS